MNPFGSSDEEETVTREGRGQRRGKVNQQNGSTGKSKKEKYPGDLNPFGEEDEEDEDEAGRKEERDSSSRKKEVRQRTTIDASSIIKDQSAGSSSSRSNGYNDSLNPFGSDDEADDSSIATTTTTEPSSLASGSGTPVPRPRTSLNPNNHSINSQPVSRETTPISLRRSIGSNVSRSSLDSRSRKVIKPSVPPPPAPASPAADPDPGSRSPLRPHRSPKKAPPPARPRQAQPMPGDKLLIVSPNDSSPNQSVVTVPDSQSNERIADPDSQPAEPVHGSLTINPDSCLTGKEGGTAGTESPTNCQMPVPARRRISLTPSAGSEATISTISVDSDQSHSNNNNDDGGGDGSSSNHIASQQDFHAAEDQAVSLLAAAQSSPSPSLDVKAGNESSPSPRPALKKRPAPAPPQAIRRTVCGSMQSIQFDLNGIGDRLAIIQSRVDQLEAAFHRDRTAGDQIPDQKSMITEYLELARETCTLGRKQEELMYQRTEHKLEQEHADLEFNIRKIDLIPKFKRTPEDEKKSKDMIDRLVDVIDQRNDVVENMTKINKRYVLSRSSSYFSFCFSACLLSHVLPCVWPDYVIFAD